MNCRRIRNNVAKFSPKMLQAAVAICLNTVCKMRRRPVPLQLKLQFSFETERSNELAKSNHGAGNVGERVMLQIPFQQNIKCKD